MRVSQRLALAASAAAILVAAGGPAGAVDALVHHEVTTIGSVPVDRYSWFDSNGLERSVSLKQQGTGSNNGGYAVQMTYQYVNGSGRTVTVTASDPGGGDGGFGYFVSHERYRDFTDGANDTIAHHVFATDDSPLGRRFPVTATTTAAADGTWAAHRFALSYPRYGTNTPIPKDANGDDVSKTPTSAGAFTKFQLPVTITWVFQGGTDFPRIDTTVDMSPVGGPDKVNFDVRGPYGVLAFDGGKDLAVSKVIWGDRYHFATTTKPVTRNASWTWNKKNQGGRYTALIAGKFEMGIYEPGTFATSALAHGYAFGRGETSASYGCADAGWSLPCDWEWPYQSLQYSLPYDDDDAPTTGKKIAWGSTPFYGTGPSLPRVYDTDNTYQAFVGWPASGKLAYSTCIVLSQTAGTGVTRAAASGTSGYLCATADPDAP